MKVSAIPIQGVRDELAAKDAAEALANALWPQLFHCNQEMAERFRSSWAENVKGTLLWDPECQLFTALWISIKDPELEAAIKDAVARPPYDNADGDLEKAVSRVRENFRTLKSYLPLYFFDPYLGKSQPRIGERALEKIGQALAGRRSNEDLTQVR